MSLKSILYGRAFVVAAGGAALCAQGTQTASVTVTVIDKSGSPVTGARVRLTSPSMMAERSGATNSAGVFGARLLPPGSYTIEVVKAGFQTVKITRPVGMDQHYQPRITMDTIGSATVSVVSASHAAIDPTDVKTAGNYNAARMETLPVPRTVEGMVALTPGVTAGVGGRTQIRGAMTSGNLYLVDGQNLMDNLYGTLQYPMISDSIEETQVITGAISAEYGSVDGGVVNTLTKSGGNRFSGQVKLEFSNPAWNAVRPYQPRETRPSAQAAFTPDSLDHELSVTLGGYFIKDRLWFHASYFTTDLHTTGVIGGRAPAHPFDDSYGGNAPYTNDISESRGQFKLTYLVNHDHYVVATYNSSKSDESRANFASGDINALVPKSDSYDFWNLAWRATWSPHLTTEVRVGEKHQLHTYWEGQGQQSVGPIHSVGMGRGFFYNMGIYGDDGGDSRDNLTASFKGSYYTEFYGSHAVDFGADYYRGRRHSRNEQSPWHNRIIFVANYRYDPVPFLPDGVTPNLHYGDPQAMPIFAVQYFSSDAKAGQTELGLYINDIWKVNDRLSVQAGLRWDGYYASADDVGDIAGASGLSPRLGVSYDPFGDQKWLFKASYSRYNSRVLEAVTGVVSACGNPPYVMYNYQGPAGFQYLDEGAVYNLAYYPEEASNVSGYYHPRTTLIDPDMDAPTCDEVQASAAYSFDLDRYGKGFLSLTYVDKVWKSLIDIRAGYDGMVRASNFDFVPGYDQELYYSHWGNEPDAKRDYQGLEVSGAYSMDSFNFTCSVAWSRLRGNYEGEGLLSPGSGENLHYMDNFRDSEGLLQFVYDSYELHPYGYLAGHAPMTARLTADYSLEGRWGRTVFGWVYRFDSGKRYSHTRTVTSNYLSDYFKDSASPEAMAFNSIFFHYQDFRRNPFAFNSYYYHDLCITHEAALFRVQGVQVSAFLQLTVFNVFNHQQLLTWNTDFNAIDVKNNPLPEGVDWRAAPWVRPDTYGDTQAASYWGAARSIVLSAGIKF